MLLSIKVYSQSNTESQTSEDWYTKGKQALEGETGFGGAKGWLEFAKQTLSENITAEMLEDVLGQGELPLDTFFNKLLLAKIKSRLFRDGILTEEDGKNITDDKDISLSEFLDSLQKYSQNDVQSRIVNVYGDYTQMRTDLDRENERLSEVIDDVKNILSQEVNNKLQFAIDSFNEEIKADSEREVDAYLKLIDAYLVMNREQEAVNAYEKCQKELGFGSTTLSTDEFNDIFYRIAKVYWKGDVESKKRYEEVKTELDRYLAAENKIIAPDSKVNEVTDTRFICSFTNVEPSLLTEAIVQFIPNGKELSRQKLAKPFIVIVYLSKEKKPTSVKLSNEIILNKKQNRIRRNIPPGDYKVVIKMPKLSIKDENRIPFRIKLRWPGFDDYIVTAPSGQRNTELILDNSTLIPCDKNTFTEHNILKAHQVPIGNYDVKIQSSIHLLPGQKYNLSFEQAPPIPSQRPWWIITAAIASGISALTYFLQ